MSGAIISSSIAALGSGYVAGVAIRVDQGGDDGARVLIQTVDGSGVPLTYLLPDQGYFQTLRGCGYTPASNVPTTHGAGSGFAINILAVGPGSDATHGEIFSFSSLAGGSGYVLHDTGNLVQGANSSATYRLTAVSGGVVISLSIDPADGYGAGVCNLVNGGPQPGGGSGASITLTLDDILQCPFAPPPSSGYMNHPFGGGSRQ